MPAGGKTRNTNAMWQLSDIKQLDKEKLSGYMKSKSILAGEICREGWGWINQVHSINVKMQHETNTRIKGASVRKEYYKQAFQCYNSFYTIKEIISDVPRRSKNSF